MGFGPSFVEGAGVRSQVTAAPRDLAGARRGLVCRLELNLQGPHVVTGCMERGDADAVTDGVSSIFSGLAGVGPVCGPPSRDGRGSRDRCCVRVGASAAARGCRRRRRPNRTNLLRETADFRRFCAGARGRD